VRGAWRVSIVNATKREVKMFTSNEIAADGYLPARGVWERYGVTSTSLYRWLADEKSDFPHPFYIGRFRYWKIADLLAWEAGRPSVGAPAGAARQRASRAVKELSVGEGLAVAGEITAEVYAPAGSESRINWRIQVDAVLSTRKVKPERATRKPQATKRDRAEASNTGGSALAAASWAAPTPLMNDDIPFAPEWR
jgi:predicted DNA-binding transcriptional regulator AlpA